MSFRISKSLVSLKQSKAARKICSVKPMPTKYNLAPQAIKLFKVHDKEYSLPFGVSSSVGIPRTKTGRTKNMKDPMFTGSLLEELHPPPGKKSTKDQLTVFLLAEEQLQKYGNCMLSLHTGFGKTCLGIFIAVHKKKKTLILCKSDKIKTQWIDSVSKFTNCTSCIVKGISIPEDADFCIMGPKKVLNFSGDLSCFGTVIVDECHQLCTQVFSESLFRLEPEYLIGLSATPDRVDGLGEILPPFFWFKPHRAS
ncbi:superfamily II helicase [Golden Marseillevirus]|uniref:superfamily II helicase n=1 Tax=Golden Marseillevirus TaxID=1720526 RepID=UPI000877A87E|nr:superfamily II helicase [Golden Marseillevirus]ALX27552.1 superfamily II helicase [Golden Marseillevirus]